MASPLPDQVFRLYGQSSRLGYQSLLSQKLGCGMQLGQSCQPATVKSMERQMTSNVTSVNNRIRMQPASGTHAVGSTDETLWRSIVDAVTRMAAQLRHYRTMRELGCFSDHRLHDIGFERDWDGSIIPIEEG
jgi:uncharacterized protein YjiS (DUF1127 family)